MTLKTILSAIWFLVLGVSAVESRAEPAPYGSVEKKANCEVSDKHDTSPALLLNDARPKQVATAKSQPAPPHANIQCGNQILSISPANLEGDKSKADQPEKSNKAFDWNAFIHDIAWPVTLLFIAFTYRRRLPELVQKLIDKLKKFKYGDTELEFLSKEANEALAKVAHGGYGTINIDAIFETVKLNEWATLIMARMLMRKGLSQLVGDGHNFGASPSLKKLIEHCRTQSLIPKDLVDDLERLRDITFFAEWWNGKGPSRGEWKWALANCKQIVERLFDFHPVG